MSNYDRVALVVIALLIVTANEASKGARFAMFCGVGVLAMLGMLFHGK